MTIDMLPERTTDTDAPLPGKMSAAIVERDGQVMSPSYTRSYPFVMAKGRGARVWDVDGAAFLDMSFLNTPVALAIASAKALLVMYFFMELRHSERVNWVVIGSSLLFLAIMILLTMSDMVSRGWLGVPGK